MLMVKSETLSYYVFAFCVYILISNNQSMGEKVYEVWVSWKEKKKNLIYML